MPSPNHFNDFFSNITDHIVCKVPNSDTDPLTFLNNVIKPNSAFSFREVSFNNVRDVLNQLSNKRSRDIYGLNVRLLRSVKNEILAPLTKLINLCLERGVFPDVLKAACVVPVFKKGNPGQPENYRPISLLPVVSKVLEKCMVIQMVDFFNTENIFSPCQFGFRKGRSTVQGIVDLVSAILDAFHNKQYDPVLFLDLSKAFDCVDHGILLRKLKYYNFDTASVNLISSYLERRHQVVRVAGVSSAVSEINIGVPQGSILGPVLFLIYINDLPYNDQTVKYTLFADDTTVSLSADALDEGLRSARLARERAEDWFCSNRLLLNAEKTRMVVFSLRELLDTPNVPAVTFLGVTLDPKLQWCEHVDALAGKLTRSIYLLRHLSRCVSAGVIRTAYFAVFHAHISYAILAWGHSAGRHRVFGLQRRAVRVVSGLSYREDCKTAFIDLRVLTVPCLYLFACLVYVRENLDLFPAHREMHTYGTRARDDLVPAYRRLQRCRDGPGYLAVKYFNALPIRIRELPLCVFKVRIKKFLTSQAFYSPEDYFNSNFNQL